MRFTDPALGIEIESSDRIGPKTTHQKEPPIFTSVILRANPGNQEMVLTLEQFRRIAAVGGFLLLQYRT